MDCRDFDRLLDALLEGRCAPDDWRRADAHRAACRRCGGLFEALAGRAAPLRAPDDEALTASILARTIGTACAAARPRLCDLVDGRLDAFDRELIDSHLARCQPCRRLAGALALAGSVLPSFAEIPPPASFAPAVLRETCDRPEAPHLSERVGGWVQRAALRPRFSLEVAYVVTLVLVLLLGDPVKAFRKASAEGTAYVQPRVELAAQRVVAPLDRAVTFGSHTLSAVATRTSALRGVWDDVMAHALAWWSRYVVEPVRAAIAAVVAWVRIALGVIRNATRTLGLDVERIIPSRSRPATEPSRAAVRLS